MSNRTSQAGDDRAGGAGALPDLSDIDLTGATDNDLLFRSGGSFIDTQGALTWDGSHLKLPQTNDAVTPTLAFGDGDTGIYESADDFLSFTSVGIKRYEIAGNNFIGATSNGPNIVNINAGATAPTLVPDRTDVDTGIGHAAADQLSLIAGGAELLRLTEAAENKLKISAPLYFGEQAAAFADVAGEGQLWVRSDTPNTPMFTDDAGNDLPLYERGSFTGTLTGYAANPTGTVDFIRIGNMVMMWVTAAISGTSNSTALTMTGIPASITPTTTGLGRQITPVIDDGNAGPAMALILSTSVISFSYPDADWQTGGTFTSVGFTATGSKGLNVGWTFTYQVD